jgi:hypothetical protein
MFDRFCPFILKKRRSHSRRDDKAARFQNPSRGIGYQYLLQND